jgi:hypothetical protein
VAKPDKTDLRNASIAVSMNAWAKATIDLNWLRERERLRLLRATLRDQNGSDDDWQRFDQ